ncbi:MAG: T9SS type A sorting domain-containing protein [Flavobacteriales bacterium]|nr:T9SS type A sorting domain-containing protein [Flavobacteriales bacterium]
MKSIISLTLALTFGITAMAQDRYLEEVFTSSDITIEKDVIYGINVNPLLNTSLMDPTYVATNAAQITSEKDSLQNWIATNPSLIPLAFFMPTSMDSSTVLKVGQLKMDIYMPDTASDTIMERPVVVYVHTGNFLPPLVNGSFGGSKEDSSAVEICKRFAKRGFVVIAPNYRHGWNPVALGPTGLPIRRATLMNAVYRAIHDVQYAVKSARYMTANSGNPFRMDGDNMAMLGQGSGGYVSLGYATLDKQAETELDKFVFGGNSIIQPSIVGDVNGDGGLINLYTDNGMSDDVDISVNIGGALGDISWMEAGDGPFVSFHAPYDQFAPFDTGTVIVSTTGDDIVDVNGPNTFMAKANSLGLNDAYEGEYPDDPYTARARYFYGMDMANSPIINVNDPIEIDSSGMEGLFTIVVRDGNGDIEPNGSPWDWWSKSDLDAFVAWYNATYGGNYDADDINDNSLLTNPNQSATQGNLYIDTIMGYAVPRMVKTMQIGNWQSVNVDDLYMGQLDVVAFPNPASSFITFKTNNPNTEITEIELIDLSGRQVYLNNTVNSSWVEVPSNQLKAGLYVGKIKADNGMEITKKFIVQ